MVEPAHPQKRRLEGEGGAVDGEDMQSRRSEPEIEWEGELRGPQRVIQENSNGFINDEEGNEISLNLFFFFFLTMKEEVNHQFNFL